MLFPATLLLVALAGQQPEPVEGQDNLEQIVQGQRYDFSVELSERLDKLAKSTDDALVRREAFNAEIKQRFDKLSALSGIVQQVQARVTAIDRQLAELAPPHPVCTYAIDKSGAEALSPAGRAALDVLARLGPAEASSALLAACREALPDDKEARVACEWVVMGAAHAVCTQNANMKPLCPKLDGADAADVPVEAGLDLATLMTARQLKRFGDKVDCARIRSPWLLQACQAIAAGDAKACPRWSFGGQQDLRGVLVDATRLLAPVDFAVITFFEPESGEMVILRDGRFQLNCRESGGADPSTELLVQPSDTPLSIVRMPVMAAARPTGATAVCHATSLEHPTEPGKARR